MKDQDRTTGKFRRRSKEPDRQHHPGPPGAKASPRHTSRAWQDIFQAIGHATLILDPEHRILAVNRAALKAIGKPEAEILGQPCYEFFHGSDRAPEGCPLEKLLASGSFETVEMEMEALGRTFLVSCTPVLDAKGRLKNVIHIATDITERQQAEEALRQREARLGSILRAAPTGIGVVVERVIREVNDRLCEMTGYTADELLGQSARMLYPSQEEFDYVGREKYRQIKEKGTGTVETRWRRKDGGIIDVLLSSTPIMAGDFSAGVTFTALDISERKAAELEIQRLASFPRFNPNPVLEVNLAGEITFFNQASQYALQQAGGQDIREFLPEDLKAILAALVREVGKNLYREVKIGDTIFGEHIHFVSQFQVARIYGLDITERKRAEAALRERESFLDRVFTSIQDGISVLDNDLNIVRVNPAMEKWYAHARPLVGKKCYTAYHGRGSPCEICPTFQTLKSGKASHEMVPKVGPEGKTVGWLDLFSFPLVDQQTGQIRGVIEYIRDITARRRAEEALRESERRFREVLENIRLIAIMLNLQGDIIFVNDFLLELTGWRREKVLGRSWFDTFLPPEERQGVESMFHQHLRQGNIPPYYENRIITREGERRLIAWNNTVRRDLSGNVIGTTSIGEDITARRRAEEALRRSEEQYRLLFEQSPLGIVHFDGNGVIQDCNDNFLHIVGVDKKKAIGFNMLRKVQDPDMLEAITAALAGKLGRYEGDYPSVLSGKTVAVRAVFNPITTATGGVRGGVGVVEDISRRKQAEEAFQNLVSSAPVGIFIIQRGKFKLVNPGFQRITGYSEAELLEMETLACVAPEFREMVREKAIQMLKGQALLPYEFQIITKDGELRWVMETVLPSQYAGERATLGYTVDITEHQHLEAQLAQAQKMEAVGMLAGGLAHDFNNLLTAITGYGDIMKLGLPPEAPMRHYVEEILKAADRGDSLTRQLLAFSRQQILQPQVLNLNEVVAQIETMLKRLIGEDIDLVTALEEDLGAVRADRGQMEQIIMNLAVNARDAMPQGGKLTIETGEVQLDEAYAQSHAEVTPGPYVMLAMSDNGLGMDAETQARIFEPFFTTKKLGKGTGLGLATVYGIVKQSGGHIWVYSEPGQGTTFKIYLPRVEEAVVLLRPRDAVTGPLQGQETILVVEDDEALRTLIGEALKKYGYQVLTASHGEEALNLCPQWEGPIHLMLTDVVMPQMDGSALAARLAGRHPEMKVLFMSGYTDNAIVHHGVLDAQVDFLQKPFRVTALLEKVRAVLGSRREED
ncbi:MAG: PAS domain S-box protein [Thermodesulfobacteriota bacterium]